MKQTNDELLKKFQQLKGWMIADTERAMFKAGANFLVAQALCNYIETIGSFIAPDSRPGVRFDAFFSRMGLPYQKLLKRFRSKSRPHILYDELRCGLTHEYVVKKKFFTIYNPDKQLSDDQIDNLSIVVNGRRTPVQCGVIYGKTSTGKGVWLIINPKYWLDFKNALENYYIELQNRRNKTIRRDFFKRARRINFLRFRPLTPS